VGVGIGSTQLRPQEADGELGASGRAFETDPGLLRRMIAHFAPADASIKQAGAELLTLLSVLLVGRRPEIV